MRENDVIVRRPHKKCTESRAFRAHTCAFAIFSTYNSDRALNKIILVFSTISQRILHFKRWSSKIARRAHLFKDSPFDRCVTWSEMATNLLFYVSLARTIFLRQLLPAWASKINHSWRLFCPLRCASTILSTRTTRITLRISLNSLTVSFLKKLLFYSVQKKNFLFYFSESNGFEKLDYLATNCENDRNASAAARLLERLQQKTGFEWIFTSNLNALTPLWCFFLPAFQLPCPFRVPFRKNIIIVKK